MIESAFAQFRDQAWPHEYRGRAHVYQLLGGTPSDPKLIEAWLRRNVGEATDDAIQRRVAETQAELGISTDAAIKKLSVETNRSVFKRDESTGELYIEGRHLKAAIKEAVSCCVAVGKLPSRQWGLTNKGSKSFVAEHIVVVEDRLYLGVTEPTRTLTRFVPNPRMNVTGISLSEVCDDVEFDFTIHTDHLFPEEQWAMVWLTGAEQGIGATRSQGYGRYVVTEWEKVK